MPDVDHIIPYSRCFDDSYQNKVLVLASENRQKGNRLPYEYFGQDEARWHGYEVRVENLIHNYRKRQKLLKRRLTEEESSGFIDRNLKDTQYITRAVYNLIRDHLAFAESNYRKKPVQAVNGAVTAMLPGPLGCAEDPRGRRPASLSGRRGIAATTPGLVQRLTAYKKTGRHGKDRLRAMSIPPQARCSNCRRKRGATHSRSRGSASVRSWKPGSTPSTLGIRSTC